MKRDDLYPPSSTWGLRFKIALGVVVAVCIAAILALIFS